MQYKYVKIAIVKNFRDPLLFKKMATTKPNSYQLSYCISNTTHISLANKNEN